MFSFFLPLLRLFGMMKSTNHPNLSQQVIVLYRHCKQMVAK